MCVARQLSSRDAFKLSSISKLFHQFFLNNESIWTYYLESDMGGDNAVGLFVIGSPRNTCRLQLNRIPNLIQEADINNWHRLYRKMCANNLCERRDYNYNRLSSKIANFYVKINIRLTDLRELYLRKMGITELSPAISQLINLKDLQLSYNNLTKLPTNLSTLTKLQCINLKHNKFVHIPHDIFKLPNLVCLILSENKLTSIPSGIGNLTSLQSLVMCSNEIRFVSSMISDLTNLTELRLGNNFIGLNHVTPLNLPPNIIKLHLAYNHFNDLPLTIYQLIQLQHLDLNNNGISELTNPLILNLTKLKCLLLKHNNLREITTDILQLPVLYQIKLRDNPLERETHNELKYFTSNGNGHTKIQF